MVIHTYTDKQTQMNGPGQGPECWEWRWGNVGEGLQEVAVTEEVGRRSRVRAFRFTIRVPKRAKGPAMSQVNLLSWCAFWAIVGRGCALISSACNGRKNSSRELYQHMA